MINQEPLMIKPLLVGTGGFLGSISRYVVSGLVYRILGNPYFPYGTLFVNVMGCLLIGFLGGLADSRQLFNPEIQLFVFIGFRGAIT
jgi:CrcB protein